MTERTPTDYALEFAEYMAKGAEQLIEAVNALALAEQARDEGDGDELDAKVDEARQDCTEFLTGLRNDIYQFRTRRDRAARAAPSLTVGDEQIEELFKRRGGKWDGDRWCIEDADLLPMIRTVMAALAPAAQAELVSAADWGNLVQTAYDLGKQGREIDELEAELSDTPAQGVELPPLPEPDFSGDAVIEHGLYSADQMHAYARAAIAQAPATKEQP